MEPFHYINQIPGKDVRGKLIDAFQVIDSTHRRIRADCILFLKSISANSGKISSVTVVVMVWHDSCFYTRRIFRSNILQTGMPLRGPFSGLAQDPGEEDPDNKRGRGNAAQRKSLVSHVLLDH